MEGGELDKSEQASPFKLRRAREKGVVARGTDLGFLTVLIGGLGFAWIGGHAVATSIAHGAQVAFVSAPNYAEGGDALIRVSSQLFASVAAQLLTLVATLFAVVLVFEFFQTGPVFSFTPIKPDFTRINPGQGLKRLFAWRAVIEAFKSIFKLAVYSAIGWWVIRAALFDRVPGITDGQHLLDAMAALGFRLVLVGAVAAFFFAVSDQIVSRRQFSKKMRMSRRELRREIRDREGDARLKQRRNQIHVELSKIAKSLRNAGFRRSATMLQI